MIVDVTNRQGRGRGEGSLGRMGRVGAKDALSAIMLC